MYHYIDSGLDYVWLRNGYETIQTPYGQAEAIHNLDGLHQAIGMHLVEKAVLTSAEIRFLRIELDMSQTHLAELLQINESTLRNWENGRTEIPGAAANMIKILYLGIINGDKTLREILDKLHAINQEKLDHIELEEIGEEWRAAA